MVSAQFLLAQAKYIAFSQLKRIGDREISNYDEGSADIFSLLESGSPVAVSRFGTTEARIFQAFSDGSIDKKLVFERLVGPLNQLSGVFPQDFESVERFVDISLDAAKQIDVLGVRSHPSEKMFWDLETLSAHTFSPQASLVDINCLAPFRAKKSWLRHLRGKKVLCIHPFEDSIKSQHEEQGYLLRVDMGLPEFELVTYRPPQTLGATSRSRNDSWETRLRETELEVQSLDFDLALIGAGAYGMPLAVALKNMGKSAIHVGGALQLFFAIRGSRWESKLARHLSGVPNYGGPGWVWPTQQETPVGAEEIEKSAYWAPRSVRQGWKIRDE